MTKEKLLAGSHFRKNKGSSIGIFLLMLLSSMLLSLAMILFTDTYPTAKKEADRLDGGDGLLMLTSETIDETAPELLSLLSEIQPDMMFPRLFVLKTRQFLSEIQTLS